MIYRAWNNGFYVIGWNLFLLGQALPGPCFTRFALPYFRFCTSIRISLKFSPIQSNKIAEEEKRGQILRYIFILRCPAACKRRNFVCSVVLCQRSVVNYIAVSSRGAAAITSDIFNDILSLKWTKISLLSLTGRTSPGLPDADHDGVNRVPVAAAHHRRLLFGLRRGRHQR